MINIISTQAYKNKITGPYKVYANLIKGLDKLGYPYVINRDLNATRRLWIHDDITASRYMHRSKAYKVVGPNLFGLPRDIPPYIHLVGGVYVQPCGWAVQMWEQLGFNSCPLLPWPVGIDADKFRPSSVPKPKRRVLVYHKKRDVQELVTILEVLHSMRLSSWLVLYGNYEEQEYMELLSKTSFVIWHGCHESQGIALQEAMACDLPILVCDVIRMGQYKGSYPLPSELLDFPVTAAPYFDETCGIKITSMEELRIAIERLMDQFETYQPRQYILQKLSLESQAKAFVQLWERWGLFLEDGLREKACQTKQFAIPLKDRLIRVASKLLVPSSR